MTSVMFTGVSTTHTRHCQRSSLVWMPRFWSYCNCLLAEGLPFARRLTRVQGAVVGSAAVQREPREQTSQRAEDRAELCGWGRQSGSTGQAVEVSRVPESPAVPPKTSHGSEPARAQSQPSTGTFAAHPEVPEQSEGIAGPERCSSPASSSWGRLCELPAAGYLSLLGFL